MGYFSRSYSPTNNKKNKNPLHPAFTHNSLNKINLVSFFLFFLFFFFKKNSLFFFFFFFQLLLCFYKYLTWFMDIFSQWEQKIVYTQLTWHYTRLLYVLHLQLLHFLFHEPPTLALITKMLNTHGWLKYTHLNGGDVVHLLIFLCLNTVLNIA